MSFTAVHNQEDQTYLITHRGLLGMQVASVAGVPAYLLHALRKGSFSLRGLARYNIAVPLIGAALGGGAGWVESTQVSPAMLARRVSDCRLNVIRSRRDDYQLIGGVLGALMLPAVFLRRVGLVTGMLGGAGLGGGLGVLTFYGKRYMDTGAAPALPTTGDKPIPEKDIPN
ncbi:hypothetical protein MPSI1_003164 [Malassezia psittaci]|uniref:Uncharacterized protein n=1 Tax=Malassezia psittaci TaxID=1821823 RepID=A0AAF0F783_9BASI|nr:hypothetical protein MPSI1_003164 [Malassezia psittaci]